MLHGSPRRVVSSFLLSVLLIASSLAQSSPPKALREPLQSAFDRKDYDAVTKIGIELLAAEPNDSLALHHVGYQPVESAPRRRKEPVDVNST